MPLPACFAGGVIARHGVAGATPAASGGAAVLKQPPAPANAISRPPPAIYSSEQSRTVRLPTVQQKIAQRQAEMRGWSDPARVPAAPKLGDALAHLHRTYPPFCRGL